MAPVSFAPNFTTPPPITQHCLLSFPTPHILLVTLNRPKALNCINLDGHEELDAVWKWLDAEPELRVGILTGAGRAFCAGADLKVQQDADGYGVLQEWDAQTSSGKARAQPAAGFGGLSRRGGKKPVVAAVNGICLGGGMEMAVNADMVVAARAARFGLPEVKRGVVAIAGALPRLVRTVGRQRAMELTLTGRTLSAVEAAAWGLVNRVVDDGDVVAAATALASEIAGNSPDSVIVSREGVKLGWEGVGAEEGSRLLVDGWYARLQAGENMAEGLRAFVEKRPPKWTPSKL